MFPKMTEYVPYVDKIWKMNYTILFYYVTFILNYDFFFRLKQSLFKIVQILSTNDVKY